MAAALVVLVSGWPRGVTARIECPCRDQMLVRALDTTRVPIAQPCIAAIRDPAPCQVQLAIKRCLVSLILLDAVA